MLNTLKNTRHIHLWTYNNSTIQTINRILNDILKGENQITIEQNPHDFQQNKYLFLQGIMLFYFLNITADNGKVKS